MKTRSDRELILACRKGRAGAWKDLLGKYERLVYSIPLRHGLSRHDAANISQLTFTILIQNLDSLPEDSRLGAWLSTVARRHTWRLLESNRRESASEHLESMASRSSANRARDCCGRCTFSRSVRPTRRYPSSSVCRWGASDPCVADASSAYEGY